MGERSNILVFPKRTHVKMCRNRMLLLIFWLYFQDVLVIIMSELEDLFA